MAATAPGLSLPDLIHGCPVERGILLDRVRRWHGPTRRRMSACADGIKSVGDSGVRWWRTATSAISLSLPDLIRQSMPTATPAVITAVAPVASDPRKVIGDTAWGLVTMGRAKAMRLPFSTGEGETITAIIRPV